MSFMKRQGKNIREKYQRFGFLLSIVLKAYYSAFVWI